MPILLKAILLGVIQGVTEFLPVSSSGHLRICHDLFGFHDNAVLFDVCLHVGTLVPVVLIFWHDIRSLFTTRRRWLVLLAAGTVPVVIVGALLGGPIETAFETSERAGAWVGLLLVLNGCMLLAGARLDRPAQGTKPLGWLHTAVVGVAQAAAVLPGISRSGSTISTGLATGLDREDAARFSFLLSVPAISLALVYKLWKLLRGVEVVEAGLWGPVVVGTLVAMVVGYVALRLLLSVVRHRKLGYFGWYCLALGAAWLAYQLAW